MMTTFPAAAAQTGPGRAEVFDQVGRLTDVKKTAVEQMRAEALGAPTRGVVAHEYQSGGWWTTSLMNHSGDPHDVVIGDGRPRPTSLMEKVPATARFLDALADFRTSTSAWRAAIPRIDHQRPRPARAGALLLVLASRKG